MKNVLFFEPCLNGHRLEYLHHEAICAAGRKDCCFYFLVPESFEIMKKQFDWPNDDNIVYYLIPETEMMSCHQPNPIKCSLNTAKILKRYVKELSISHVFLNTLIDGMPLLPFCLPSTVFVSGIIYSIYLWQEDELPLLKLMMNRFCFWLFAHHPRMNKILLLNDRLTSRRLNDKNSFSRFADLPDPITDIDMNRVKNIRSEYGIPENNIVYLQFPINKRKHPIDILKAIDSMSKEVLKNKSFVFAGNLDKNIAEDFEILSEKLKDKCQIITIKERVSYETLFNLCYSADVLLTLYDNHYMSSGVLGYAAYFNKCVISTGKGLLGKLVNEYHLGYCVRDMTVSSIVDALHKEPIKCNKDYASCHRVSDFTKVVFECFDN